MAGKPTLTERVEELEAALAILTVSSKVLKWCRTNWRFLLGVILIPLIAIAVTYFTWWQPQHKQHDDKELAQQVNSQIEDHFALHHFDELAANVNTMKGQMNEISGFVKIIAEKQMKQVSSLPPREFQDNLHEVRSVLAVAKISNANVSHQTVNDIQSKLVESNRSSADFWGAASAMINYRSPVSPEGLPPCDLTDKHAPMLLAESVTTVDTQMKFKPNPYENCEIVLDSPEAQQLVLKVLGKIDIVFRKCKVIYRGGTLLFPKPNFPQGRGQMSLIFENCTFIIETTAAPQGDGKSLMTTLLAAKNLENVNFSVTHPAG